MFGTKRELLTPRPFGNVSIADAVDARLGGGLPLGYLHEIEGAGAQAETGGVTAAFCAALLARLPGDGDIFWIAPTADLYAPGIHALGLDPGRLVMVATTGDAETLAVMEVALRGGAATAVVGEVGRMGRLASRRLQFACARHGTTGLCLRRWPHGRRADTETSVATTRWRIAPAPGASLAPRWEVTLTHARGGREGRWMMEVDDATHALRVAAELADPAASQDVAAVG